MARAKRIMDEKNGAKEKPKCSFCFKTLITDRNNYLKNRYKCKFWNNNAEDKRTICYPCLKYAYTRGLPLIASGKYGGKKTIFSKYIKAGMFKEYENA